MKYSTEKKIAHCEIWNTEKKSELITQWNPVLVDYNNSHGTDPHVFSDVISRRNKYKCPMNKQGSFFQFLQHCSKVIILNSLKWNLMDLHKGLDDMILDLAWHIVDTESRVFLRYGVVC